MAHRRRTTDDPLWYQDAVIYELHVRSFADSNGDGVGDFRGLTEHLDYLQDLGVDTLWLLPFYPSPLRDDGYDIADYTAVNPAYGTLDDFKTFLAAAHRRGLRVIIELVLNHTSDQHPWFRRARRAPRDSPERAFYVWSDTPDRYRDARIIFKDFEPSNWSWDPVAQSYFWHRFYAHQPDLNWENPAVRAAMYQVLDFWLNLGVDGMRLDAVPYLFEREGTNCENLPETHAALRELRRHVDERHKNRMLLAEANQWPEDAVQYFGQGDECHMAFHFPIMPRMFMAVYMEDRTPIEEILAQTPAIPAAAQWAIFLRNHDELTLEMVTDEERDYMYRVYAKDPQARINLGIRRRLAPLFGNHRRAIELLNSLLLSLPGTPVIYYGDEIGMGDNIYLGDRNGVRTPMQWSSDRNAGFSRANPQRLFLPVIIDPEYHYETVNVEAQRGNPRSLLWWMKRMIALRKRYRAFGRGTIEFLRPENGKVLAFVRRAEGESILVVANLSRFAQAAELDLSADRGKAVVEMFGRAEFPPIRDTPYPLTLGPHSFYWFELRAPRETAVRAQEPLEAAEEPMAVLDELSRGALEERMPAWLAARGWRSAAGRSVSGARIQEAAPVSFDGDPTRVLLVALDFADGPPETYFAPLAYAEGARTASLGWQSPDAVVSALRVRRADGDRDGVLYDAAESRGFCAGLIRTIADRTRLRGSGGELVGVAFSPLLVAQERGEPIPEPALAPSARSNTLVTYGDRWVLKLLRHVEEGPHPEVEIGRLLAERTGFTRAAPLAGALEFRPEGRPPITVAVLYGFLPNQGEVWGLALDELGRYFDRVESQPGPAPFERGASASPLVDAALSHPPPEAVERVGPFLDTARRIGRLTADMHVALASVADDPAFAPEPFSTLYQRSINQAFRSTLGRTLQHLRRASKDLPAAARPDAQAVLDGEARFARRLQSLTARKLEAQRIRIHGDYRLQQVLVTGKDFAVVDFEGDPHRALSERRLKRSPLRDVASMLWSFDEAAQEALAREEAQGLAVPERAVDVEAWARFWRRWCASAFLKGYLEAVAPAGLLPAAREDLELLLQVFLLDRGLVSLARGLRERPDRIQVPLRSLRRLLDLMP